MPQTTIIPAALATPVNAAFSTATTGGTLAAGTYFYRVSALGSGGETLASAETSQATTGATSTVTVNWGAVTGATGYKVYGRTSGGQQLIASVGAVTTYTDTGSITPSGALPTSNTTGLLSATSTDITVAAGSTATVGIFASVDIPNGVQFGVWADTPANDVLLNTLSAQRPSCVVYGPGTFRLRRGDISQHAVPVGAYAES